jgi:protease-4
MARPPSEPPKKPRNDSELDRSIGNAASRTSGTDSPPRALSRQRLHVVQRESIWATKKIALVDVDGVLRNGREHSLISGGEGENPVALFKEKLDRAANDDRVKAIVVRINSPGGSVTASDLMYTELKSFRERTGKPVIASMLDVAASGGYYLACAADQVFAQPTTITGSIGVIMMLPQLTGTMQKLGIEAHIFKSGPMKDSGSPFREMNDRDRQLFEHLIRQMYDRFVGVVAQARSEVPPERVRELADGRVYLGPEAKEHGLVDEVGTLEDALVAAKSAAGLDESKVLVVEYARPLAHRPNVYADGGDHPAQVNLINVELPEWLRGPAPQLMYLWAPGW